MIVATNYGPKDVTPLAEYGWLAVTQSVDSHEIRRFNYAVTHVGTGFLVAGFDNQEDGKNCAREMVEELEDPLRLTCSETDRGWARCAAEFRTIAEQHGATCLPGPGTPNSRVNAVASNRGYLAQQTPPHGGHRWKL